MAFPASYNFSYYQGDKYEFVLRPKQANGEAFDLSGYTGLFTVATARGNADAVIGESQEVDIDANAGTVTVAIEPSFGTTLTGNSYLYDVEISASASSGSNIFTLVTGTISITRDITNTYGGS
jgi:hypothetical protein